MSISLRDVTVVLLVGLGPVTGHAVLGGAESSVEKDRGAMKADAAVLTTSDLYRVHVLTVAGTSVREYVTNDGTVFAVTWQGQTRPDLSVLLGANYQEYRQQRDKVGKQKGRVNKPVSTVGLVVRHSGHMGAVRGQAYLPNLVPAGVQLENLP